MRIPRRNVVPVVVLAAATLSFTVAGCAPSSGSSILESLSDSNGELANLDVTVPAGWPDDVPLQPGTPISAGASGTSMTYVTVVDDQTTAVGHVDALIAAGFEVTSEQTTPSGGAWSFTNGTYQITYQVNESDQGNGTRAAYLFVDSAY
jgi:hypothetical protein